MSFLGSSRRRRLSAERLEQRVVMAGNVDVTFFFPELFILGDANDSAIELEEIAPNTIKITGLAGTTINSGSTPVVIAAALIDSVFAKMNDGDDRMVVRNMTLTDNANGVLSVTGGAGDDNFLIDNVQTTDSVLVDMGEGDDVVRSRYTKVRNHVIATGNGSDSTVFEYFSAGTLQLTSLEGEDKVVAKAGGVADSMSISSGPDNDTVALKGIQVNENLYVRTAQGDDSILAKNIIVGGSVVVIADAGNSDGDDSFDMRNAKIGNALKIATVRGDDTVYLRRVQVGNLLKMDTGYGNDEVDLIKVKASIVSILTGAGGDDVHLQKVLAPTLLHVRQGDGEDRLELENCDSDSPEFDGGAGADVFDVEPNLFLWPSDTYSSNYESFV